MMLPDGLYQLVTWPDKRLEMKSEECTEADLDLIRKMQRPMFHIMKEYNGIGLAAVQVGVTKRFFTLATGGVLPDKAEADKIVCLINPVVIEVEDEKVSIGEGCLSLPLFFEKIERSTQITVKFRDLDWKEVTAVFTDIEARCVLHEIDHLDGVLQSSKLSLMKRQMYEKKVVKGRKHGQVRV